MEDTILSIIMPLYNVEKTLQVALDSIFMQDVNFPYEIIVVDDASTDKTLEILEKNKEKYPQIKIIKHERNQGNAISFYDGLSAANGKYFCVLDGDDYYTVRYKLQKQVDFLNGDTEHQYVAVSHKFLKVDNDYNIIETNVFADVNEIDYKYYLQNLPYSHTTTYMYRNLYKNKVPKFFKEEFCRGDNPRTFFHVIYTKGKIKMLNFVGSVYRYDNNGIWSKTSLQEQRKRNLWMYEKLSEFLQTSQEKDMFMKIVIARFVNKKYVAQSSVVVDNRSRYIDILLAIANKYSFSKCDFSFKSLYTSLFVDSVAESIGYVEKIRRDITLSNPIKINDDNIMIVISKLTTTGGGVYYEIKDIIEMYDDKKVYLLFTDLNDENEINEDVLEELKAYKNLRFVFGQTETENKIEKLFDEVIKTAPRKIYHYLGHNNLYASTLLQSDMAKNICVFSFDHGFSLGLMNSNYDCYIAKRPADYEMLNRVFKDKVIFLPCWNKDKSLPTEYKPYNNHSNLITACASARFYKLQGKEDENYIDFVLTLLENTKGKHVHLGPIEENIMNEIKAQMQERNIPEESFVYIEWAKNIVETLLENNVDIFLEPFPTVSYKITLEILSAGIPIIAKESLLRMQTADFLPSNSLMWSDKEDFINKLKNLSAEELQEQSISAKKYFVETHDINLLKPYFKNEKSLYLPQKSKCIDNYVLDCENLASMFEDKVTVRVAPPLVKKRNKLFSIFNGQSDNGKMYKIVYLLGVKCSFRNKKKERN